MGISVRLAGLADAETRDDHIDRADPALRLVTSRRDATPSAVSSDGRDGRIPSSVPRRVRQRPGGPALAVFMSVCLGVALGCGSDAPVPTATLGASASVGPEPTPGPPGTIPAGRSASPSTEPLPAWPSPSGPVVEVAELPIPDIPAPGASAQARIAAALAAGAIDRPTFLRYRAYAILGDPALPPEYAGEGEPIDDPGLFAEIALRLDELPPDSRAELEPLLLRPTDPRSVWWQGVPTTRSVLPASVRMAPPHTAVGSPCSNGWANSDRSSFRMWATCDGDYQLALDRAFPQLAAVYGPLRAIMGDPRLDLGTADAGGWVGIDIYLIGGSECVQRDALCRSMPANARAFAVPTEPYSLLSGASVSSGYIVMDRDDLMGSVGNPGEEGKFRATLAHEVFHLLQFAHNLEIVNLSYWFTEASATWAGTYAVPAVARRQYHIPWFSYFQADDQPLNAPLPRERHYAAYVWPYFMAQEEGAAKVGRAWTLLEGATSIESSDVRLDANFFYRDHLRDFAVRNVNRVLEGDPIQRYSGRDTTFPDDLPPSGARDRGPVGNAETVAVIPTGDPPHAVAEDLPILSSHYYHLEVDDEVAQFTLDFAGLAPARGVDVDLIYRLSSGQWERRELGAERTHFCRNRSNEDVEELYVITTNHEMDDSLRVTGEFTHRGFALGCYGLALHYTSTVTLDLGLAEGTATCDDTLEGELLALPDGSYAGEFAVRGTGTYDIASPLEPGQGCNERWSGHQQFRVTGEQEEGGNELGLDFESIGRGVYETFTQSGGICQPETRTDIRLGDYSFQTDGPGERFGMPPVGSPAHHDERPISQPGLVDSNLTIDWTTVPTDE